MMDAEATADWIMEKVTDGALSEGHRPTAILVMKIVERKLKLAIAQWEEDERLGV